MANQDFLLGRRYEGETIPAQGVRNIASTTIQNEVTFTARPIRGFLVDGEGTINFTCHNGTVVTDFPARVGRDYFIYIDSFQAGGTATNVWVYID